MKADRKTSVMKKVLLVVLSVALVAALAIGGTVAWMTSEPDTIENKFSPESVSCAVVEDFENNLKSNVRVENTSSIDAYIRAAIVVNWAKNGDEDTLYASTPAAGTDYEISLNTAAADNWFQQDADAYYYYKQPVAPDDFTTALIESCTYLANAPAGYHLQVTILAEAIQAEGVDGQSGSPAVNTVWPVERQNDGSLAAVN